MRPTRHPQSALRCPLNRVLGAEANVRVLRAITLSDIPVGVSELARLTMLQASGVARVCTRLEDLGVIEAVGRGAPFRQYRRASRFPFANTLAQVFNDERAWGEETLREIHVAVQVGAPLKAAWIEGPVALGADGPDDAVIVGLLAEPAAVETVRADRWQRLMPIQTARNVTIELKVLTVADLRTADAARRAQLEHVLTIMGPPPLDLAEAGGPKGTVAGGAPRRVHEDLDARSKEVGRIVAERIRRDPSLVEDAKRYIERRILSASPGERMELEEWRFLLANMSVARLRRFLVQDDARAIRLRQSSPFLNALTDEDRLAVLGGRNRK